MDFLQQLWDKVNSSVDFLTIAIVFASGFFQSRYLDSWRLVKKDTQNSALRTLVVSFGACAVYIILAKDETNGANWAKYFFSFFMATSLYELWVKHAMDWIGKKFGGAKTANDITDTKP